MAVFKAYMRIAKKNMWMILMYLCIFLGVTVMFQHFAGNETTQYTAQSIPVGIMWGLSTKIKEKRQKASSDISTGRMRLYILRMTGRHCRRICSTGMWNTS